MNPNEGSRETEIGKILSEIEKELSILKTTNEELMQRLHQIIRTVSTASVEKSPEIKPSPQTELGKRLCDITKKIVSEKQLIAEIIDNIELP